MTVGLSCFAGAGWQFFDNNGVPLTGGLIYVYAAGTTTPATTYTSNTGLTPNTNPIVLDSAGRTPAQIWVTQGASYKFVLKNAVSVTIGTYDNISSVNDLTAFSNTTDINQGDALIGFRQSNSGGILSNAVARTVHQKFQDYVSVKDFGAKGDGATDDTAAIQAAPNAVKTVYFPTGTYIISSKITIPDRDTRLYGDGIGSTELRFGSVLVGLEGVFSISLTTFCMTDMVITTTQSGVGTGLSLTWPEDFDYFGTVRLLLTNLIFRGASDYTNGWNTCALITQCDNASFVNCSFKGQGGDPFNFTQAANTVSANGVTLRGRYSPTDFHFTNCWFYCFQNGVNIGDTIEGVTFHSCTFVEVRIAISWLVGFWSIIYPVNPGGSANGRPQLMLLGCHVNCFKHAVLTNGVVSIHVGDSLIYHIDRATETGSLISCENATEVMIHDNEFWSFNTTYQTNGVFFSTNVSNSTIRNNAFVSPFTNAFVYAVVFNDPTVTTCIVTGITLRGTFSGGLILDNGVKNAIGTRGALAYNISSLSLTNNTGTIMVYSDTAYDTDGFWSGSGGRFTIPQGVLRVRLTANVIYANNSTGYRLLQILKNGSPDYVGVAEATVNAVNGDNTLMSVSTGVLSVSTGDYFEVKLLQNSGGALTALADKTTFAIEVPGI